MQIVSEQREKEIISKKNGIERSGRTGDGSEKKSEGDRITREEDDLKKPERCEREAKKAVAIDNSHVTSPSNKCRENVEERERHRKTDADRGRQREERKQKRAIAKADR